MNSKQEIIRVLHVINSMDCGGAETLIMNLYRCIDRDKIQFDFLLHSYIKGFYDDEITQLGGKIYRVPHFNLLNYASYKNEIYKFFKSHNEYKIIHGHLGSCSHIYLSIAKDFGCKTIVHCHSSSPYKTTLKNLLYKYFSKKTLNYADYIFSCNIEGAQYRYGKDIATKNNFKIFKNAIDVNKYKYTENDLTELKKEFKLNKDDIIIGHVGSFSWVKNHEFIVDVFYKALKTNPKLKLFLVGNGSLKDKIQSKVGSLQISDKVVFTGVRCDVHKFLHIFDCFILPSFREGIPLSLIEAQAASVPCVVSSNVSKESIITESVVQLSLEDPKELWISNLLSLCLKEKSLTDNLKVKQVYDINNVTIKLQNFYTKIFESFINEQIN